MKRTNKIISLMLSVQMAATSVFAGPVFLQKQPNPIGGVTAPLDNKDKKSIDAKTIAKKTVLFPLKALWWVTKPQLIMLGTAIFDLSLLTGYGIYKLNTDYTVVLDFFRRCADLEKGFDVKPLSYNETAEFYADMYYCAEKLGIATKLGTPEPDRQLRTIAKKYAKLSDKFEIMDKFLSHYYIPTTQIVLSLKSQENFCKNLPDVFAISNRFFIFAFDKSFEIGGKDLKTIVEKFYRRCSLLIDPTKNLDNQERATEMQQKLNAWKETMYAILAR